MATTRTQVYLLIGLLAVFRLIYINFAPIVPQEAYYWHYAQHPALGYFDHPPMTAWVIALFTTVGGDSAFFVRIGAVLFSVGLLILLYSITVRLFGEARQGMTVVVIASCSVLLSIGSTFMTPDVPLLFFWTLAIYFLVRLRESGRAVWWYAIGVSFGLALLSKYSAILIPAGIGMYLLWSNKERRWLATVHPYLGLILGVGVFAPVLIWNSQHEWASFLFQSSRRFSEFRLAGFRYIGQLLGSQFGLLTPYIFVLVIAGWFHSCRRGVVEHDDRHRLLASLALPVYVAFSLPSLFSLVKMNWMAPAYIPSLVSAAVWIGEKQSAWAGRMARWYRPGLALGLVLVIAAHLLPLFPIVPLQKGDTWSGWGELTDKVNVLRKSMGADVFIFSHDYKIPSEIAFCARHQFETHAGEILGEHGLQYRYWTDTQLLLGKDAMFITSDFERFRDDGRLNLFFEKVEKEPPLQIIYRGKVFRTFYIYRCYRYLGPQPGQP